MHWTGGNWQDRSQLRKGYKKHYEHVRKAASAAGMEVLEFQARDGWVPLCQFLGKKVPDEPYPHVNEGDWVVELHYFIFWVRVMASFIRITKLIAPILVAGGAYWVYRDKFM